METPMNATAVDIPRIEQQLREMWRPAAGTDNVTRASRFTLIVWCETEEDRDRATATLAGLTSRHPCRAIVLLAEPQLTGDGIAAAISAQCHLTGGGRKQICCEQIFLHATGTGTAHLAPTVLSLLESDLPAVLWWRGDFLRQPESFRRLADVADRILFDSSSWPDAENALPSLAAALPARVVADLSWTRLTWWRRLTADCFDEPPFLALLPQIETATILHGSGPGARLRALLYAGWLASHLGWSVEQAMDRVWVAPLPGEDVAGVGIQSVELTAAGALVRLEKDFDEHTARAIMTRPEACGLPRTMAFAPWTEESLLSAELDHAGHHAG
jgi:glucose-6-phosphate dehydrogenase assembly protein OpcA